MTTHPAYFEIVRHSASNAETKVGVQDDGITGRWFWKLWKTIEGNGRAILGTNGPYQSRAEAVAAREEYIEAVLEAMELLAEEIVAGAASTTTADASHTSVEDALE